ncbi:tyrosine-type recombinase/integrase [Candidatus Poribacteria bacterium]|nr:tyrosine-type recombinase/integrase [Candidatus Poribacteria bacterium]
MKGARPLDNSEILLVSDQFTGTYAIRNRSLFMLGVSVGGRISELLALTIGDVWQNHQPVKDLLFQKDVVKGKETARMVPVNADGRKAIADLIDWHKAQYGTLAPERPLFVSRQGGGARVGGCNRQSLSVSPSNPLTRGQAHKILLAAFTTAGLNGKLATHSMRKSYAQRMYDAMGDIYAVKEVLGHQSVETTKKYLGVSYQKLQRASDTIAVLQVNKTTLLYHSPLAGIETDTLIVELQRRGFDARSLIDPLQPQQKVATAGAKVIPISTARRTLLVGAGNVFRGRDRI